VRRAVIAAVEDRHWQAGARDAERRHGVDRRPIQRCSS
jgi:hypothetical protein